MSRRRAERARACRSSATFRASARFETSDALILKDGRSTETARLQPNRITGDVTKVLVTVTVVK